MSRRGLCVWFGVAVGFVALGCSSSAVSPPPSSAVPDAGDDTAIVIQDYAAGLAQVHVANSDVKLSIGSDPELSGGPVLSVQYPLATNDPAGRDVNCDAENQDWTAGNAVSFQIKPAQAVKISVSFLDRNHVAYTDYRELEGGAWQPVRITFADWPKNLYFQPKDAKLDQPMDVSEVTGIAFAPQVSTSGSLAVSKFVVVK